MNTHNRPQFTVVIPLYNKLQDILRTIDSVLAQTFNSFEVIVVDDGSTDGSANLVEKERGEAVKLVRQLNGGVSRARNRGVEEASGKIIAFIDADDTWEPHFLEEMAALKKQFPHANAFASSYQFIEDGGRYIDPKIRFKRKVSKPSLIDDYFFVSARGDLPFMMSSICIDREAFINLGGFPEGVAMGEDQDLFARLAVESNIAYNPSILAFYHLDSSNRACHKLIPTEECSFSKNVFEAAEKEMIDQKMRQSMLNYTAAHLLHIASLNIRMGRLNVAKQILSDKRCKMQPLRYAWWLANYSLKKITSQRSVSIWA